MSWLILGILLAIEVRLAVAIWHVEMADIDE